MILLDLSTFLGHLHPLVVHLPIGFLFLAAGFNVLSAFEKYRHLRSALEITSLAGFLSAIIACLFGYLLSLSGDYDVRTLSNHKYSGIALAFASGILWFLSSSFITRTSIINKKIFATASLAVVLLIVYVGHQGGTLTHGAEYLSLETLTHVDRLKPSTVEEAFIFEDVIAPTLEKRCAACHRDGKRKGELVLTSWESIMKGGKHGKTVVSESPSTSELFRRITLDRNDEDFMPSDGKTPLTKSETAVIKWWITHGAVQNIRLSEMVGYDSIKQVVSHILTLPGAIAASDEGLLSGHPVNPLIPETVDSTFINGLRKSGFSVRMMSHHPVMLDITLPSNAKIKIADVEQQLETVAQNIVWLNLSHNDLDDNDLNVLKKMTNVEKIRLEGNPIGDGIVGQVKDLKYLNAINLNETKLSSKGLSSLKQNQSLKSIYFWKTPAEQMK